MNLLVQIVTIMSFLMLKQLKSERELSPVFLKKKKKKIFFLEYNHDRSFVYIAAFTQIYRIAVKTARA